MSEIKKVKSRKLKKDVSSLEKDLKINNDTLEKIEVTNKVAKRIKPKKIKMSFTNKEEKQIDHQMETEENISIVVMLLILVVCFILGITLGYMLYRIAINNSSMFIVRGLFNLHI